MHVKYPTLLKPPVFQETWSSISLQTEKSCLEILFLGHFQGGDV